MLHEELHEAMDEHASRRWQHTPILARRACHMRLLLTLHLPLCLAREPARSHKCLKNRHGEDAEAAAASGCWVCPVCRGSCGAGCVLCCNCGPCRKKVRAWGGAAPGQVGGAQIGVAQNQRSHGRGSAAAPHAVPLRRRSLAASP
jgi:hypothetical protein